MRRIFDTRARLAVYFENADLTRLTAKAREEGKLLAEWARETLLKQLEDVPKLPARRTGPPSDKGAVVKARASVPYDPSEVCEHEQEPGMDGKCRKWGCKNYAFRR